MDIKDKKAKWREVAKWAAIMLMIVKLIADGLAGEDAAYKAAKKHGVDPLEAFKRFKSRKAV